MSDTEQYDSEQNDLLNGSAEEEEEETHEESAGLDLGEDAQPQHEEEPDLGGDEEEERFSVEDSANRTEEVNGEEEHETELHNGTEEHKEEEHSSSSEDEQEEKGDGVDDFLELEKEKEKEQVKEKEKKEKIAAPQTPTKNGADKQTPKRPATAPRAAPKGTAQARRVSSSKPATPVKAPSPAGKTVGPVPAGEFSPAVTNKAKKIQRSGNVFDSLYEDAIKRREKRALALQQIEMEKQKAARSPEVSKYAQKTARERNVFEALYADATARREKKEGQTPNASPAKRQQQ